MLRLAKQTSMNATVALMIVLVVRPGTEARAQTAAEVLDSLKKLPQAEQEKFIKEAPGKLGLLHANLFQANLVDTITGSLKHALSEEPTLNQQALQTKAEEQFSQLLKLSDDKANLTDMDKSQIAGLVSTLLASGTASALPTTNTTPPAAQPPAAVPAKSFLQKVATLADLESFLLTKKLNIIKNQNLRSNTDPTTQELLAFLTSAVNSKPTGSTDGSFLSRFNQLTGQKVVSTGDLSPDDQAAVKALVARVAGEAAPTAPSSGGTTDSNPTGTAAGAASSGSPLTHDAITGTVPDELQAFLLKKKTNIMKNYKTVMQTNGDPPAQAIQDFLTKSLNSPTTRANDGTFLGEFNKLTSHNVTDFSQLSTADQAAAKAIVAKVAGLPTPPGQQPSPGTGPADDGTSGVEQTVETALDDAGLAFVPGFAAFEPLANTLFQDLWSGLGRLRPFQRLHARRGYMLLDDDGSMSAPASSSGARYIIVP